MKDSTAKVKNVIKKSKKMVLKTNRTLKELLHPATKNIFHFRNELSQHMLKMKTTMLFLLQLNFQKLKRKFGNKC